MLHSALCQSHPAPPSSTCCALPLPCSTALPPSCRTHTRCPPTGTCCPPFPPSPALQDRFAAVPVFWTGLALWLLFLVAPLRPLLGLAPKHAPSAPAGGLSWQEVLGGGRRGGPDDKYMPEVGGEGREGGRGGGAQRLRTVHASVGEVEGGWGG